MDVFAILWLSFWNLGFGSIAWHQWRIWKKYAPAESRVEAHGYAYGNGELTLAILSGDFAGRISRLGLAESDALQDYPLGSILSVRVDPANPERSELPRSARHFVAALILWIVPGFLGGYALLAM